MTSKFNKMKGYRSERNIRLFFEKYNWKVIRAGASLGEADLICIKNGRAIFLQIKSTKNIVLYYDGYMPDKLEGLPFYLVVDFGYGRIRILSPQSRVLPKDGMTLKDFLR